MTIKARLKKLEQARAYAVGMEFLEVPPRHAPASEAEKEALRRQVARICANPLGIVWIGWEDGDATDMLSAWGLSDLARGGISFGN